MRFYRIAFMMMACVAMLDVGAQKLDSLKKKKAESESKTSDENKAGLRTILTYVRVIRDAAGNVRVDENFVPNFRLNKYFTLELGLRQGEQTFVGNEKTQYGAYNHYKIELQTKRFKTFRLFARLSDNIIRSPSPQYSRSNYVLAFDGKPKIWKNFSAILAYGYVVAFQQNNKLDAAPIMSGSVNNYPIFKVGLQYNLWNKGHIDYNYGSYDTFNPYLLKDPFTQVTFDYELTKRVTFYSYYRREYLNNYGNVYNRFFTAGVTIHFSK